jgi:hypothetical protein
LWCFDDGAQLKPSLSSPRVRFQSLAPQIGVVPWLTDNFPASSVPSMFFGNNIAANFVAIIGLLQSPGA